MNIEKLAALLPADKGTDDRFVGDVALGVVEYGDHCRAARDSGVNLDDTVEFILLECLVLIEAIVGAPARDRLTNRRPVWSANLVIPVAQFDS